MYGSVNNQKDMYVYGEFGIGQLPLSNDQVNAPTSPTDWPDELPMIWRIENEIKAPSVF